MWLRLVGAAATVTACSAFGFGVASDYRRRVRMLRDFLSCVQEMELQLQQSLLPLPQLTLQAAALGKGTVYSAMQALSDCLRQGTCPDVAGCMCLALEKAAVADPCIRRFLTELGRTLGRFDLPGQLRGLQSLTESAGRALARMEQEQAGAVRVYRTLGVFGGMALAVYLI